MSQRLVAVRHLHDEARRRNVTMVDFEAHRDRLRAIAFRILGSAHDAEDAVQEAWLRLNRANAAEIGNVSGWLTTVTAHIGYDMLRTRSSRREEPLEVHAPVLQAQRDPADEAILADAVGLAVLVVLDTLDPAERLAFVLHDMFGVSFDEIARIVDRSPAAARQLASRARRRLQGSADRNRVDLENQKKLVDAFLAAMRNGDFEGLVAVLDPDAVFRADEAARAPGSPGEVRGARTWAAGAIAFARGARFARLALIDGEMGVVVAPGGRLFRVLQFTYRDGKIAEMSVIGDAERLREIEIAVP
jgi:RNA polymerase sigma factor (sigma-70 family)